MTNCPECGSPLEEDTCTILIEAKSDTDDANFLSNLSGAHFCGTCPIVVFTSIEIEKAVMLGLREDRNLEYAVLGIVDLNAIPYEKREDEIGTDDNPVPLVQFLPNKRVEKVKKIGRNDPCPCGSGKKYKKCCQ